MLARGLQTQAWAFILPEHLVPCKLLAQLNKHSCSGYVWRVDPPKKSLASFPQNQKHLFVSSEGLREVLGR